MEGRADKYNLYYNIVAEITIRRYCKHTDTSVARRCLFRVQSRSNLIPVSGSLGHVNYVHLFVECQLKLVTLVLNRDTNARRVR